MARRLLVGSLMVFLLAGAGRASPVVLHSFAAPPVGSEGSVNTYWMETEHGVIVVDGLRTLSDARAGLEKLRQIGKPISAIFITHPHPDHVGGVGVFASAYPGVPIYGSATTRDEIIHDTQGLFRLAKGQGLDFPDTFTPPNTIVRDGEVLNIDGVKIIAHVRGRGEALDALSLEVPGLGFFEGDVVSNRMTVFMLGHATADWLGQLRRAREEYDSRTVLYPGHGQPGPALALADAEIDYLTTFRGLVSAHRGPNGTVGKEGKSAIHRAMDARYPDWPPVAYGFPGLMDANIDAVAQELGAAR